MRPEPAHIAVEDIRRGLTAEFRRKITQEDIDRFADLTGDYNPLHVDPSYAAGTNYGGTIVHGAFQIGLASALIGMRLPGRDVLLASVSSRFENPLPIPSEVTVHGEVTSWNLEQRSGKLRVRILLSPSEQLVSEFGISFTTHEKIDRAPVAEYSRREDPAVGDSPSSRSRKTVLVTGASGGIGSAVAEFLAGEFEIVAQYNRHALPSPLQDRKGVKGICADLTDDSLLEALPGLLGGEPLYGIVSCAWPGLARGGILTADSRTVARQVEFGSTRTIELAKLLFQFGNPEIGGRFIALSSSASRKDRELSTAAYSLGKNLLESCVELIAPELAQRNMTANVISPSMVACGMNRQVNSRILKRQAAAVPMGRLCTVADICETARFLLDEGSGYISGQVIELTGGRI